MENPSRFHPGQSGNPGGRPPGALNKTTTMANALLEGESEKIMRALIEKAIAGNVYALRLVVERLIPIPRDRFVQLPQSPIGTAAEITATLQIIFDAVSAGQLTPGEAQRLATLLESKRRAIETMILEERIAALEASAPNDAKGDLCP